MTDAPTPPKRRRRKLIVAVVVLVSLVATWWFWPRGDARFVGKWTFTRGDDELMGGMRFRGNGVLEFYAVGVSIDAKTGQEDRQLSSDCVYGTWNVSGDTVSLGWKPSPIALAVVEFVDSYVTLPLLVDGTECRIIAVDGNEITLSNPDESVTKLRRLPE